MATIAVVGWGSLIWCPGALKIRTRWRSDGPALPIEFARISQDGRLTLVIYSEAEDQTTYWAISELETLVQVRRNLKEREQAKLRDIRYVDAHGAVAEGGPAAVIERIQAWMAKRGELDAVVWTGLGSNWPEKRGCAFCTEDAVRYVRELQSQKDRAVATFVRVREYIRNTPPQIQTAIRRALHLQGWQDAELPGVLFDG